MMRPGATGPALLFGLLTTAARAAPQAPEPPLLADGRTAVVALPVPGFARLTPVERVLAWHLVRSGRGGSRLYAEQKYAPARELSGLADALALDPEPAAGQAEAVRRYRLLLRAWQGPHDPATGRKTVLPLARAELLAALRRIDQLGPARPEPALVELVDALWPALAAPEVDPVLQLLPPAVPEPLARTVLGHATPNGFYQGVSIQDLDQFGDRFLLLSSLVRRDGILSEQPLRAGDGGVFGPGGYAAELASVAAYLDAAVPSANAATAPALRDLAAVHRAGTAVALERWLRGVVRSLPGPVFVLQGFLDLKLDPRARHGAFGSAVCVTRPELQPELDRLLAVADLAREGGRAGAALRGAVPTPLRLTAADLIEGQGAFGPASPRAVLLPPTAAWREKLGCRVVLFVNRIEAELALVSPALERQLCGSDDQVVRAGKWGQVARRAFLWHRETLGRVLGAASAGRLRPWQEAVLDQARADLIALWTLGEVKFGDLELLPHADAALAAWELCAREFVARADETPAAALPGDPELLGRRLWCHWLLTQTRTFSPTTRAGLQLLVLDDADEARRGAAQLLQEILRMQVDSDQEAADALLRDFALNLPAELPAQAARLRALSPRASRLVCVPGELTAMPLDVGPWVAPELPPPTDPSAALLVR
jgi:hypothetical protein